MAKRLTVEILVMVALGLLVGLLGPFGTFAAPPAQRMLSWVIWLLAGYALFRPINIAAGWLCEATGLPHTAGRLLAFVVASVPLTLLVTMMVTQTGFADTLRWPGFWTMYLYICVISVLASVVMATVFGRKDDRRTAAAVSGTQSDEPAASPPPDSSSPSLPLPPGFGPVCALKGEDHYVRVIGEAREELILMRMRDAIERLDNANGLRVHRSWWVAKAAVASVHREGRTAILTLRSGHEAPVARDMMPQLRAAGWL